MKKALIITLEQGLNYGGMLQAYALKETVQGMGYEVDTTWTEGGRARSVLKSVPGLRRAMALLKRARYTDRRVTTRYTQKFLDEYMSIVRFRDAVKNSSNDMYEAYITGSDQVWRATYTYVPHNLFSFVDTDVCKIAYAASFGTDTLHEYSPELVTKTRQLARQMTALSVREKAGVQLAQDSWGIAADWHVDPTLLLDQKQYGELIDNYSGNLTTHTGGIFEYVLDTGQSKSVAKGKIRQKLGLEYFTVIDGDLNSGQPLPPVEQWIKSFEDAEFVVTDSFHGTVFSIIFNKPFIAIGNKARGLARFTSLLETFGLEDRLVESADEVTDELLAREIAWDSVNAKIKTEQQRSHGYLQRYLA